MAAPIWFWVIFNAFIILLLILDLTLFHRKASVVSAKETAAICCFWVFLALLFGAGIHWIKGKEDALNFLTGYIIELSLSIDNLFVFLMIFTYFNLPEKLIHKTLFWGILGAIIMRATFIVAGIALINAFHWIFYLFGLFLIYSGIHIGLKKEEKIDIESNPLIRLIRRFIPIISTYENEKFFIYKEGKLYATALFLVLICVETTDVLFSLDSIPAIFGITRDPFIVYTSNIFAILGLRTMYFFLSKWMSLFYYLHYGLACVLIFIGVKMLIEVWMPIPIVFSLLVIILTIGISILASLGTGAQKGKTK